MLDYLCCDESQSPLPASERVALFDLAQSRLNPGGLFATSYRAYEKDDGALQFIVRSFAPHMNEDQKQEFLTDIKRLGGTFLSRHADIATRLNDAIAKAMPDSFMRHLKAFPYSRPLSTR